MKNRDGVEFLKSDMTVASWRVAFCGGRGLGGSDEWKRPG